MTDSRSPQNAPSRFPGRGVCFECEVKEMCENCKFWDDDEQVCRAATICPMADNDLDDDDME